MEFNRNDPKVRRFCAGYAGRKSVKVSASTKIYVANYWDGGSKTETSFYDLSLPGFVSFSEVGFVKQTAGNPFNQAIGEVELKENLVAVQRVIFMGKDMGVRVIVHPNLIKEFEQ